MRYQLFLITTAIACITGCGSVGSTSQTSMATNVVLDTDQSKIEHVSIAVLHKSFLNRNVPSPYAGKVVEVSGTVVAFALTDNGLYTITILDDETDAICIFNDSISGQLGDGRSIRSGATLTLQGQCRATGLFSSKPFTLDGCTIVTQ